MNKQVMRKGRFFGWMLWIGLVALLVNWNCKSDPAANAPANGAVAADDAGGSGVQAAELSPEDRQKMEPALAQVRQFEADFAQFNQKFEAMRDEVKNMPAKYKKNAKDFDQLKAYLEQFGQSSDYIKAELSKLKDPLEAKLNPPTDTALQKALLATSAPPELAPNWEDQIGVLERTIIDFGQSLGKTEAVVEKLKKAKGAPVVLFE